MYRRVVMGSPKAPTVVVSDVRKLTKLKYPSLAGPIARDTNTEVMNMPTTPPSNSSAIHPEFRVTMAVLLTIGVGRGPSKGLPPHEERRPVERTPPLSIVIPVSAFLSSGALPCHGIRRPDGAIAVRCSFRGN
jgi:hypothetical protein